MLAQVLINRGLTDPVTCRCFLQPRLTDLVRPHLMPGVSQAARLIRQAIDSHTKITIYGDYDVDGIAAVVILIWILRALRADVDYYIPHRIEEGYGLNDDAIRYLASARTGLLITVDCGITARQTVELAKTLGMQVIITDHHALPDRLPSADAIVHPAMGKADLAGDPAGAAIAMKLAWEIANQVADGNRMADELRQLMLDATCLAALGTICDLVELKADNRIIAHFGLKAITQCRIPGLQALIEAAGLTTKGLASQDIGFIIGPMLNAAGRMGHARLAVELLLCKEPGRCRQIAEYLKAQNTLRQSYCLKIFNQACQMVEQRGLDSRRTIVVVGKDWHLGLLGIVAARLVDRFGRPAIVLSNQQGQDDLLQGSGRSIPGFCLLSGLKACSRHLLGYGGHSMAAGLRLKRADLEAFIEDLEAYANKLISDSDLAAKVVIDAVAPLSQFTIDLARQLEKLAPFGQGNPRPVFACRSVHWLTPPRAVGSGQDHLQLAISDHTAAARCIGFNMGHMEKRLLEVDFFDIAFEPRLNHYNGNTSLELLLHDIRIQ